VDAWQLATWESYRDVQRLGRRTRLSVFNGPLPEIHTFPSERDESEAVGTWLRSLGNDGIQAHEIGLFVRSQAQVPRATVAVATAGLTPRVLDDRVEIKSGSVNVATMHLAKGLCPRTPGGCPLCRPVSKMCFVTMLQCAEHSV
jgi:superfamily I DNA/RNA helicase